MSELKSYIAPTPDGTGLADYYLKSEADKVIADLEMKLAIAQQVLRLNKPEALFSDLEIMGRLKHQIDVVERREHHQKYKRCVAMRNMCRYAQYWYSCLMEIESCKISSNNIDFRKYNNKYHFYLRWRKRWNEFAEEPTWAKFLQLIHKEEK